jgi:hypothetical protein
VFDDRRLNRQVGNSTLKPSVRSTATAFGVYFSSTRAMTSRASLTLRLISPLAGNARMRSPTSADNGALPRLMISVTSSHGIMPLSAYENARK